VIRCAIEHSCAYTQRTQRGAALKRLILSIGIALIISVLFPQPASASSSYTAGSLGVDISYPNCSATVPKVSFGIVGVTGGLVYSRNGCAAAEAAHFTNLSLYMNTGLNAISSSPYYTQAKVGCNGDVYCAAYNYGSNAAKDALSYAASQGIGSSKWWLDVETSNTWNADTLQNQKSLQGAYDALVASGATTVGAYSTTAQWQTITGGLAKQLAELGRNDLDHEPSGSVLLHRPPVHRRAERPHAIQVKAKQDRPRCGLLNDANREVPRSLAVDDIHTRLDTSIRTGGHMTVPGIAGFGQVKLPVSDLVRSPHCYADVFDLRLSISTPAHEDDSTSA
jgi:hypothetical protein